MIQTRSGFGRRLGHQSQGRTAALCEDTRGAILVIGLLGAIVLLGVLWMVFRLGDTIALREQAGAAADAIAFSAAVVHARSMNMIALFNILEAAIVSIRVMLRGLELVCLILAIPTLGASMAVWSVLWAADEAMTPVIEIGIDSIGMSAGIAAASVPGTSRATAKYLGRRFSPIVKDAIVANAGNPALDGVMGLPLDVPMTGMMECGRAASFLPDMMEPLLAKIGAGWLAKDAAKPLRKVVGGGSLYFCGMGVNLPITVPGTDDLAKQSEEKCKQDVLDAGLDPESSEGQAKYKDCVALSANLVEAAGGAAGQLAQNMAMEAVGIIPPTAMAIKGWQNGDPFWQIVALATLDLSSMAPNAMVNLAAFGKARVGAIPEGLDRAVAEAEFYYDCTDYWKDGDCGGPEDPTWNLRWKARLVRTDVNSPVVKTIVDPLKAALQKELSHSSKAAQYFYGNLDTPVLH